MEHPAPKKASCVAAINPETGEILAVSRRGEPDQWVLPGGKEDDGENAVQCAMREFFEEVGVRLLDEPILVQQDLDNAGYLNSTYLVVSRHDLVNILHAYDAVKKENEPGIMVCFQPFAKLLAGPFAQSNAQVLAKLLAALCRKLAVTPVSPPDSSVSGVSDGGTAPAEFDPLLTGATIRYRPSKALTALIMKTAIEHYGDHPTDAAAVARLNTQIDANVRGFIASIGLTLDADAGDTYTMTQGGALKDEIQDGYVHRLPVNSADEPELIKEITRDLYRYAGHTIMEWPVQNWSSRTANSS